MFVIFIFSINSYNNFECITKKWLTWRKPVFSRTLKFFANSLHQVLNYFSKRATIMIVFYLHTVFKIESKRSQFICNYLRNCGYFTSEKCTCSTLKYTDSTLINTSKGRRYAVGCIQIIKDVYKRQVITRIIRSTSFQ